MPPVDLQANIVFGLVFSRETKLEIMVRDQGLPNCLPRAASEFGRLLYILSQPQTVKYIDASGEETPGRSPLTMLSPSTEPHTSSTVGQL